MLSNTRGLAKYSRNLGFHKDDLSKLSNVCPALRSGGKCKSYTKEQELRRSLAAAKEAELLKKATALYQAQMDLLEDANDDLHGSSDMESNANAAAVFSVLPEKKAEVIGKLVAELKQEPAYLNWSLDAAVAEKMVELHVRPCKFTHRAEVAASLKRSRSELDKEEGLLQQQHNDEEKERQQQQLSSNTTTLHEETGTTEEGGATSSSLVSRAAASRHPQRAAAQLEKWAEERHRVFATLTPLQRCVVCLLWQRTYRVAQGVVCDVRLMLERKLTDAYEQTGRAVVDGVIVAENPRLVKAESHTGKRSSSNKGGVSHGKGSEGQHEDDAASDEDPLDAFLSSAKFEELVEQESARVVTRVAFRPEYGMIDLSALPLLVAHLSTNPTCGVLLARTLTHFTGKALPPLPKTQPPQTQPQHATTAAKKSTALSSGASANGAVSGTCVEDDRPAPEKFHYLLFPMRKAVTEKEVDLGGDARANEVVEAIEWALQVYQREAQLQQQQQLPLQTQPASAAVAPNTNASLKTDVNGTSCFVSSPRGEQQHFTALFRHQRVRLHGLTLRHCKMTSADALVGALHKRHLERYLYALDLSENRLWSLRFLLVLRAHFAQRLLRLSLKSNPITRKPEYQEQVRLSLPQLTSLDGEPIRRPPLRLPKPLPISYTRVVDEASAAQQQDKELSAEVQAEVLDCVNRFLYIWETRRIPRTARELAAHAAATTTTTTAAAATTTTGDDAHAQKGSARFSFPTVSTTTSSPSSSPAGAAGAAAAALGSELQEEELNEDNFPHRYLHPSAMFSVTMAPGMNFFDAATMRDARTVELDADYAGMRLSAADVKDARVFDVAMKNSSRNLLAGRPALQRFGKGAENCYAAYQFTLYPERMTVEHHLSDAVISVATVKDVAVAVDTPSAVNKKDHAKHSPSSNNSHSSAKKKAKVDVKHGKPETSASTAAAAARFGSLARTPNPTQYVVTLHGTMTWQLPSMKAGECMRATYARLMIFTKKVLPAQNREWERLRSPPYVLVNDQLFLMPTSTSTVPSGGVNQMLAAPSAIYRANTPARLARLVVEFGLEACRDGAALVRDVMERTTSPASEYAALQALVLGLLGPRGTATTASAAAAAAAQHHGTVSSTSAGGQGRQGGKVLSTSNTTAQTEDAAAVAAATAAEGRLTAVLDAFVRAATSSTADTQKAVVGNAGDQRMPAAPVGRTYVIFSVLDGAAAVEQNDAASTSTASAITNTTTTTTTTTAASAAVSAGNSEKTNGDQNQQQQQHSAKKKKKTEKSPVNAGESVTFVSSAPQQKQQEEEERQQKKSNVEVWASKLHIVTRKLLNDVTEITNACYTSL